MVEVNVVILVGKRSHIGR